ncbi:MAG: hypothetical protein JO250_09110 [Armatimonadetes bacterium]|nr:hypothetical protein [Armatimonadota bacterium]
MKALHKKAAVLGGALLLTAFALPVARAQTPTPDAGNPPAAPPAAAPDQTTPPATTTPGTATPPPNATPATPVETPETPSDQGQNAPRSNRFRIGPAVGVFLPTSGKVRDRFGDTWFSIGIGLGSINPVSTKGTLALDLNLFYHERDGNRAFFAPLGLGYRIALAPGTNVIPYAGVSGDINFADITSNPDNVHNSFNVGVGASAFTGLNFGDTAFLEARYYALSSIKGFDLSGLNLQAGYRF